MSYAAYDDLMGALKRRVSCRKFAPERISEREIRLVAEAGTWAPSGHNSQTARIIRVKDEAVRAALAERTSALMNTGRRFDPFYGAPELFVVVAEGDLAAYDGALTMYGMMLAASSLGLGSCWVNTAQIEAEGDGSLIRRITRGLGLPPGVKGVGYLALGRPAEENAPKERKGNRYFEV